MNDAPTHLFWLDLETSGLNPHRDVPLEVAAIVTTVGLVEEGRDWQVISWPDASHSPLHRMTDDVEAMHQKSGLLDDIGGSVVRWRDAREQLARFAAYYPGAYLAGSGVHFDRAFLSVWAPEVLAPLHYRNLDVSTLRTFAKLYQPGAAYKPAKAHRAMADVHDAIAELRHYRDLLVCDPVSA